MSSAKFVLILFLMLFNGADSRINNMEFAAKLLREIQLARIRAAEKEHQLLHHEAIDVLEETGEVLIEGIVHGRFDVDLKCSGASFCRPLHISVRPNEQAFVFNAMFDNGMYDVEERRFFFLQTESFIRISIVNLANHFEIVVNDNYIKTFEHRMSSSLVKQLKVKGSIDLKSAQIFGANSK